MGSVRGENPQNLVPDRIRASVGRWILLLSGKFKGVGSEERGWSIEYQGGTMRFDNLNHSNDFFYQIVSSF